MVDVGHEAAGGCCGHGAWDNVVGAAGSGKALGNDFIPMEEAGVVDWRYVNIVFKGRPTSRETGVSSTYM